MQLFGLPHAVQLHGGMLNKKAAGGQENSASATETADSGSTPRRVLKNWYL